MLNILWIVVIILIVFMSIYLTFKLKGIQFRLFKMFKALFNNNASFKTLIFSLAGKIGVGSIAGIALAIYLAGPGVLFWIWIISLLSIPIVYSEVYLGMKHREKKDDKYYGGPAYYLKNGLKKFRLGLMYSITIIISYIIGFVSIQSNTITKSLINIISIKPLVVGIVLCIITSLIIFDGIKKIINITNKIVPVMTIIYLGLVLFVIIKNIDIIPSMFKIIINSAFNYNSFNMGFFSSVIIGIQRGIFSNEAGIGTSSIAASVSNNTDIISESYAQMLGVYITSFLICTGTGIMVILSNYGVINIEDPNGIEIATYTFNYHFGNLGNIVLIILILLFAFSTILSAYYYGEVSLNYFSTRYIYILRIILLLVIVLGSIFSSTIIWNIIDLLVALLIIINIYAIYKLKKEIK